MSMINILLHISIFHVCLLEFLMSLMTHLSMGRRTNQPSKIMLKEGNQLAQAISLNANDLLIELLTVVEVTGFRVTPFLNFQ